MSNKIEQINLIKQQLRTGGVLNEDILALYQDIPRHEFVPSQFQPFAYSDLQIRLPHDQRMMTPLEEAITLQALKLNGTETILEIGTGTGFFTALLSRLCKKVISIDYFENFTQSAETRLKQFECNNVELFTGDACHGWSEAAPYDVIIYTGAIQSLTDTERLQLTPNGKLFAISGNEPAMKAYIHHLDNQGKWTIELMFETCLPYIIDPNRHSSFTF